MVRSKNIVLFIMFFIGSLIINNNVVYAKNNIANMESGVVTYYTIDTKATTSITWSTEGFIVKNGPTKGNPTAKPKGKFMLTDGEKLVQSEGGMVRVTFTFPEDKVSDEFEKAKVNAASLEENGGNVYLNAIIRVFEKGVPKEVYQTLTGIKNARDWNNKNDFADRFDIILKYKPTPQPIQITYMEYNKNRKTKIKTVTYDPIATHSYFKTDGTSIPQSMNSTKTNRRYKLYRVHWAKLSDKPQSTDTGTMRKARDSRKTTFNPKQHYEEYVDDLDRIRNRKFEVVPGGVEVVAIYKWYSETPNVPTPGDVIERELIPPTPEAVIQADTRGQELFDVTLGIPTTESLYTHVSTDSYLMDYCFQEVTGEEQFLVHVIKTYQLHWTIYLPGPPGKDGSPGAPIASPQSDTVLVDQSYYVRRGYSYWKIKNLNLYGVKESSVSNETLPGQGITLHPSGYQPPSIQYQILTEQQHVKEPEVRTVNLGSQTLYGQSSRPSIPNSNWSEEAEKGVSQYKVRNDRVVFDNQICMDDLSSSQKTPRPVKLPECKTDTGPYVLYCNGLIIARNQANEVYESEGTVTYEPVIQIGDISEDFEEIYEIDEINEVLVHTPVVCDGQIENVKRFNQMWNPDQNAASLVLDTSFTIQFPVIGNHNYIKGYGYRDYGKYTDRREVQFPFDVYQGSQYYKANSWIRIAADLTSFYVPPWVREGIYSVQFKATAINTDANQGNDRTEDLANSDYSNYVAEDAVRVQVSGRIYGLKLYDVTDYPLWQSVFRLPNSLKLTGVDYAVGTRDRNGSATNRSSLWTLPLLSGSHPKFPDKGVIKSGYLTRFTLYTMGDGYEGEENYVRIRPIFYYVNANGGNREEVDLYYSETFQGKKQHLIRMGSARDQQNKKYLRLTNPYTQVPENELEDTLSLLPLSMRPSISKWNPVYTYTNMMLPWTQRTFAGTFFQQPPGVSVAQIKQSIQKWYGEYYIPSEIHAVSKNAKVMEYAAQHGVNYHEPFWKKDGYIIINFQPEFIKDKERYLSYINASNAQNGYCNMWQMEGSMPYKQTPTGTRFACMPGDYVYYSLNQSAAQDYIAGGTH